MEELTAIKTAEGREFKPWATKDDLQAAVQNPASVTATTSEIAAGKVAIAQAINAMGGTADISMSFAELADVIRALPAVSLVSTEEFSAVGAPVNLLKWLLNAKGNLDSNFTEINDSSITNISVSYGFNSCTALRSVSMSSLTTISGGSVFSSCTALRSVSMPSLTTISGDGVFNSCTALQRVYFPNLTTAGVILRSSGIREFICPKLTNLSGGQFYQAQLNNIVVGTLTSIGEPFTYAQTSLYNITIGENTNINLPFQNWTGTNVSPTDLNANIMANLVPNLMQDGGKTLRLGAALYDVLTTETKDAITDRGWTLQRG